MSHRTRGETVEDRSRPLLEVGVAQAPVDVLRVAAIAKKAFTASEMRKERPIATAQRSHRQAARSSLAKAYLPCVRTFRYAAAVAVAAAGGGVVTRGSAVGWYPSLRRPSWTPPSRAFGPVWTVLYAQMAYSAHRVARSPDPRRRRALALWWLQLGLNAAWTPVFFGARRTGAGAVVICMLLPAVAATAIASARVDRPAGLLFAPYFAWSTYAAALNLEIWRRNRA
jgi:translocator protein